MSLADKLQLARLFADLALGGGAAPDLRVSESEREAAGARYDWYLPRSGPRATLAVAHGGDRRGRRNARVVRLCRLLARRGVACAVPELAPLARGRFDPHDLDELAAAASDASAQTGQRPGLLGFCLGAGYALALASRAQSALRFVVAVGGFHDLPALLDWHAAREGLTPQTELAWDDAIYFRLWLAIALREELGVAPALSARMEDLLERFCDESSAAEKRAFFEEHLRPLAIAAALRGQDRARLAAVSPCGRLAQLGCPVTLIHDRHDGVVPLCQAERAYAELAAGARGERHRLVVTEVLSQLTPARALDLPALARLAGALVPLVALH